MSLRAAVLAALVPFSLAAQAAVPAAVAMTQSVLPHGTFVLDRAPDLDKGIAAFVTQAPAGQRARLAARLKDVDPLYKELALGTAGEALSLTFEGRQPLVLPLSGQPVTWTRAGEPIQVSARPSVSGLLQTYQAEDGVRTNEFILLPDGRLILSVQVHVNGLPKDLSYKVVYRAEK